MFHYLVNDEFGIFIIKNELLNVGKIFITSPII